MSDATAQDDRILWDVVEEHLEEAEFLFEQWRAAVDSPLYTFAELDAGPEHRLRAHLDGLAVGGRVVIERLLWPTMGAARDEPMRRAAATLAVVDDPDPRWLDAVIGEVGVGEDPSLAHALALALDATERADVSAKIAGALERTPDAPGRARWLSLLGRRGGLPGRALHTALADPDPAVRVAAIRAARFAGRVGQDAAQVLMADTDAAVVAAATEVGLVLGMPAAWSMAQQQATSSAVDPATARAAMLQVALVGDTPQVDALVRRLGDPAVRADAIWALGFSGRVEAIEPLLALLDDDEVGPLAGEAFAGITGLDPSDDRYWVDPPLPDEDNDDEDDEPVDTSGPDMTDEDEPPPDAPPPGFFAAGAPDPEMVEDDEDEDGEDDDILAFEDDDLDADLTGRPEDDLRRPIADEIRKWWQAHRTRFDARQRWLAGKIAHGIAYAEVLRIVSARRRHAIALELAIRTRGAHHIPTRALTGLQRGPLAALAGLTQLDGARAFPRIT